MNLEEIERFATLEEISLLFVAVQQLGQVLSNQTHGAPHRHAREFNELLYLARKKLDLIRAETEPVHQLIGADETVITSARFTTRFGG